MSKRLVRPAAVLFDVGGTLLEERRFDLEAGIAAVVPDPVVAESLAVAFRAQTRQHHQRDSELLLVDWLRDRVPALMNEPSAPVEDRIWSAVVTLVPRRHAAT